MGARASARVGDGWRSLLARIASATTFDEAAGALMESLVQRIQEHVHRDFGGDARVLRAIVHVRPDAEYSRVAVHQPLPDERARAYAPSATTWRWIAERGCPVLVDVRLGLIEVLENGAVERVESGAGAGKIWETQRVWQSRDATHVIAWPLRAVGGGCCGMVTVEVQAPAAVAKRLLPVDLVESYSALCAAVTPHLEQLPVRSVKPASDARLPVLGASMQSIVQTLAMFAVTQETLLLSGPTGAGKSRLAEWVHARSPRAGAAFAVVHLATRPEGLRMAELYGWKRGAFTGAVQDTPGALSRAEGGTLFLDEIDKLSLDDQAGLLRVLEDGAFRPFGGGDRDLKANVRFILGTNVDLRARVRDRTFREDLYYRIHVLPVRVPPLSERRDEIAGWASYMLERRHRESIREGRARLAEDAGALLERCDWPGNLRQLDNIVRRAYALLAGEHPTMPVEVVMGPRHIERALAFEGDARPRSLLDAMHAAATAFVLEAEQRAPRGGLDLDLADALRGLVLAVAAQKNGGLEQAFKLFQRESVVHHRNHVKTFRKELARIEALYAETSGEPSPYGTLVAPTIPPDAAASVGPTTDVVEG